MALVSVSLNDVGMASGRLSEVEDVASASVMQVGVALGRLGELTRLFVSVVRRGDDGVFGLREECVSCVRFHIPLLALHSPHPVSGRLRPLGHRRTSNTSNYTYD